MTDEELGELYYRTTLELTDQHGTLWAITPTDSVNHSPSAVLAPFTEAFILTAENPESSGENTPEDNARATAALASDIDTRGIPHRPCPGYGFDVDHVEHGFALLATEQTALGVREHALELARRYRQNAIFHLSDDGLAIIGALRPKMNTLRPVRIEQRSV